MKKMLILLDDWYANKVFVEGEIKLLKDQYKLYIVAHDIPDSHDEDISFIKYTRRLTPVKCIKYVADFLTDKEARDEVKYIRKEGRCVFGRIMESLRFYINANLFFDTLLAGGAFDPDEELTVYSYWYFWKCFAFTHNRDKFKNIRIVSRTHNYELYDECILKTGRQPFKHAMDAGLERLVFLADYGRDYYLKKMGYKVSDKYPIYSLGTRNDSDVMPYRRNDICNIVSCSYLVPVKRVHLIIKALALVEGAKIKWTHFGNGPLYDSLKEEAHRELDGRENIEYDFKGFIENKDLMEYYKNNYIDLFITATEFEGVPVSVMEAMSFGMPVILPDVCGLSAMIRDNGLVLSSDPEPSEIKDAMLKFTGMPDDEKEKMRLASRKIWEDNYMADKNTERFVREVFLS